MKDDYLRLDIIPLLSTIKCQSHTMVKHTETICRLLPTNYLSVLDHFLGLALKGLKVAVLNRHCAKKSWDKRLFH